MSTQSTGNRNPIEIVRAVRFEDAIGAIALILLLIAGIWVAYGIGLPTGGDQLVRGVR